MQSSKIIISRTDNIGDVILTLPLTGLIKESFPDVKIAFLGTNYTKAIIENCAFVDEFYDLNDMHRGISFFSYINATTIVHVFPRKEIARLAKAAGIETRIGTSHRIYHWWTCNKLVNLGRKRSNLHETQLNLRLLYPLGINVCLSCESLYEYCGWKHSIQFPKKFKNMINPGKFNIIFHIKSKGSSNEWNPNNFYELAKALPETHFNIMLSGTREEGNIIAQEIPEILTLSHVKDISGVFTLREFIAFIQGCDGLLASSTGPLHIAAISGKHALGLYPNQKPMSAERWAPLGPNAEFISEVANYKTEYLNIPVKDVEIRILNWLKRKK